MFTLTPNELSASLERASTAGFDVQTCGQSAALVCVTQVTILSSQESRARFMQAKAEDPANDGTFAGAVAGPQDTQGPGLMLAGGGRSIAPIHPLAAG